MGLLLNTGEISWFGHLVLFSFVASVCGSQEYGNSKMDPMVGEYPVFRDSKDETRIVGGDLAEEGDAPYQISMRLKKYNFHFCGGSIINDTWILTAAHCCTNSKAEEIEVVAGTLSLTKGGTKYDVEQIISHEAYNSMIITNDIALLKLKEPIKYEENIQPIELSDRYVEGDETMKLTGWGMTSYPGNVSKELKIIDLKSITNMQCMMKHFFELTPPISFFNTQICTLNGEGEGACKGDSGGPLVSKSDNKQAGVVSWGIPCAKGAPDVFTRVSAFRKWISTNMERVDGNKTNTPQNLPGIS